MSLDDLNRSPIMDYAVIDTPIKSRSQQNQRDRLQARHLELQEIKDKTISYLFTKIQMEDWHGVADGAMDIRDFEAEMKGIELALG